MRICAHWCLRSDSQSFMLHLIDVLSVTLFGAFSLHCKQLYLLYFAFGLNRPVRGGDNVVTMRWELAHISIGATLSHKSSSELCS